jgi:hypothetical protein
MLAEGQLDLRLLPHRGGEADLRGGVSSYSAEVGSSVRRGGHEHEGRDDPGVYRRWWRTRDEDAESAATEGGRILPPSYCPINR